MAKILAWLIAWSTTRIGPWDRLVKILTQRASRSGTTMAGAYDGSP
jgi:hypothetical protein